MKVVLALVLAVAGAIAALLVFQRSRGGEHFDELYREAGMQRTPKLEALVEVQRALAEMKAAGMCGLIYNARVSQTSSDPRLVYDCATGERFYMRSLEGSSLRPFAPHGVAKLAVLQREGQLVVVTEGAEGQNTFDELAAGIPKVLRDAIAKFPAARAAEEASRAESAKRRASDAKRQNDVKDSFD